MNQRTSKALRRITLFKPHQPRQYQYDSNGARISNVARRRYQAAKKNYLINAKGIK